MRTLRVCLLLSALAMFTEVMMPDKSRGADKAQLDDLAQKLKEPANRAKAIADAAALGKEGKILARALCEAACDKKTRAAAIEALKAVEPELPELAEAVVLLLEGGGDATTRIRYLGVKGNAAVPAILWRYQQPVREAGKRPPVGETVFMLGSVAPDEDATIVFIRQALALPRFQGNKDRAAGYSDGQNDAASWAGQVGSLPVHAKHHDAIVGQLAAILKTAPRTDSVMRNNCRDAIQRFAAAGSKEAQAIAKDMAINGNASIYAGPPITPVTSGQQSQPKKR